MPSIGLPTPTRILPGTKKIPTISRDTISLTLKFGTIFDSSNLNSSLPMCSTNTYGLVNIDQPPGVVLGLVSNSFN